MACWGHSRRKIYRLLNVRSALLSVPLVWLLFIWWTIYYTQTMEKVQSRRQLTLSYEQLDHIDAFPHEDNKLVFPKANGTHSPDSRSQKDEDRKHVNDLRFEIEDKSRKVQGLNILLANNRKNDKPDDNKEDDENAENDEKVLYDQNRVHMAVQKFADVMNHSSRMTFTQPHLSSASNGSHYFEFSWNGGKPRPDKKVITPGKRFDLPKLGEFGMAVKIIPEYLNQSQREKYEEGWRNYKFNEYASLQISTQRQTPDNRPSGCKNADKMSNLQKASIIICFYNEAWSVLLRTVHSVLTRSPPELITEIILVDDYSNFAPMGEPLEHYVSQVDKLRLLRMTSRSGLVRARLAGVKEAKGPILIFLDSHVECAEGWLPPLLQSIQENPNYAVTPEIDVIDHKDFSIHAAVDNIGVFVFDGFQFDWASIMPRIKNSRKSLTEPIKSPAMAGGLFAIRKDYFVSIGTYDPGLEVWGGENIELSLKLWMCGGGIIIHPCSRVAHIFRDDSPYLINKAENVLYKNSARVAQVWADEYRDLYFKEVPYSEKKYGSVKERIELRARLQCHSFSWYLDNVYPEMYIAGAGRYLGKIKSLTGLCINEPETSDDPLVKLVDCSKAPVLESSRMKEIRTSTMCMDIKPGTSHLAVNHCNLENKSQTFEYTENNSIYHVLSNTCLTASSHDNALTLKPCSGESLQTWFWPENDKFITSS